MKFENRWFPLSLISAGIGVLGLKGVDLLNLSTDLQAWIYYGIIVLTVFGNIVRIHIKYDIPTKKNPLHYFPTLAAIGRLVIALMLGVLFFSKLFPSWPSWTYMIYFFIVTSSYDTPGYHKQFFRDLRLVVDTLMALISFLTLGGVKNPIWLMFLIPVMTISRHYPDKKAIYFTLSCVLMLIAATIALRLPHFSLVDVSHLWNIWGVGLPDYLAGSDKAIHNWDNFKKLTIACITIILPVGIFLSETKNRLKKVSTFTVNYFNYLRSRGKSLTPDLLNYLCIQLNVEAVVGVVKGSDGSYSVLASFQNHNEVDNYSQRCCSAKIDALPRPDLERFMVWWSEIIEAKQFTSSDASAVITGFQEIFLSRDTPLSRARATAKLYKKFEIIALIPIKIIDSYLIFVNSLPTKYRVVPRPFWSDTVDKIRTVHYFHNI